MDPLELGRAWPPGPGSGISASASPARSMPSWTATSRAGALGVAAPGVVQREHRVGGDEQHPRTVTQPGLPSGVLAKRPGGPAPTRLRFLVIMTDDTLRWRGGWARLGSWRGRRRRGLPLRRRRAAPRPPRSSTAASGCCAAAATRRSSPARWPMADALPFLDAGFSVRERLHLLAHSMGDLPRADPRHPPGPARPTAPRCSTLDHLSFDGFWRLDDDGLTNAIQATPSSRFRVAGTARTRLARLRGHRARRPARLPPAARGPPRARGARATGARSCSTGCAGCAATAPPRRWSTPSATTPARSRSTSRAASASCPPGLCVMGRSL